MSSTPKPPFTVALLCGGTSNEREISLVSAAGVADALEQAGHTVVVIDTGTPGFINRIVHSGAQVAFIALHGTGGEDGTIQGLLELLNIPYTGSGVLASALAMDKQRSKVMYEAVELKTPRSVVVACGGEVHAPAFATDGDAVPASGEGKGAALVACDQDKVAATDVILRTIGVPCVIKPVCDGSSVGVSIVHDARALQQALSDCFAVCDVALAEAFVAGTEVTISVLGNAEPFALPIIEIIPQSAFYDFESKYAAGGSEHIIPARISPAAAAACLDASLKAHRILGCRGMSRTDIIVSDDDEVWLIETNTIPGMTPTSLLPEAARAAGINPPELYSRLIDWALEEQECTT